MRIVTRCFLCLVLLFPRRLLLPRIVLLISQNFPCLILRQWLDLMLRSGGLPWTERKLAWMKWVLLKRLIYLQESGLLVYGGFMLTRRILLESIYLEKKRLESLLRGLISARVNLMKRTPLLLRWLVFGFF